MGRVGGGGGSGQGQPPGSASAVLILDYTIVYSVMFSYVRMNTSDHIHEMKTTHLQHIYKLSLTHRGLTDMSRVSMIFERSVCVCGGGGAGCLFK